MTITQGMPLSQQPAPARNCGKSPIGGAAYFSVDSNFFAKTPIFNFLIDPVWPLPPKFGMAKIGMQLRERYDANGQVVIGRNGKPVYDIWDHVGSKDNPNPSDIVLEIDKLGLHQLAPLALQFDLLSNDSDYFMTHSRAHWIETWKFYENPVPQLGYPACPKNYPNHISGIDVIDMCPRLWWENLIGDKPADGSRRVTRKCASFSYEGYVAPPMDEPLTYTEAAFFRFPLGRVFQIKVYEDPDMGTHIATLKKLESLEERLQKIKFIPM